MKVLAIAASPRRNANSETLLDRALAGMKGKNTKIKKIVLAQLHINPCHGCLACHKTGECVIEDDMQPLYENLLEADILLVASPIYFMGLPCQLKCVIDRCQVLWARKHILKKSQVTSHKSQVQDKKQKGRRWAAAILVCASSGVKNMFTGSIRTLKAWFKTLDMEPRDPFIAEGLEEEAAALKDKKLLKQAVKFGKDLICQM
jgi:multimeric flavodoxin WrbA